MNAWYTMLLVRSYHLVSSIHWELFSAKATVKASITTPVIESALVTNMHAQKQLYKAATLAKATEDIAVYKSKVMAGFSRIIPLPLSSVCLLSQWCFHSTPT